MYKTAIYTLMIFNRPKLFNMLMNQFWYKDSLHQWIDSLNCNNNSAIELGCGPGALLPHLATKFSDVTGVDSSRSMLNFFKKINEKNTIKTILGDALDPASFNNKKYDLIVGASLINVVKNKEELIINCINHLEKNGIISFFYPTEKMNEANVKSYIEKNKPSKYSAELLHTWAKNSSKKSSSEVKKYFPEEFRGKLIFTSYLSEMTQSVSLKI